MSSVRPNLESQLEQLLVNDDEFRRLENEFDQFCPFEALGMVRSEVRHGNFLAYLLEPGRPHGFHTDVLRAFLLAVSRATSRSSQTASRLKPLNVHLMDIEQADVRREWRSIDLLIVIPAEKLVIPIELKVESSQGSDQLLRYRRIVESQWPKGDGWRHVNVFLTKYEEEPIDAEHWHALNLRDLVAELDIVSARASPGPGNDSLKAYLRMLRRHHLEDADLEDIARKLWSRHREALEFLADNRPDATANLFEILKERKSAVLKSLKDIGLNVVLDAEYKNIIRFAFEQWDTLPGFKSSRWTDSKRLILLELKREKSSIAAYLYLGPGDEAARSQYLALLDKTRLHRPNARAGRDWMCLAKADMLPNQIDEDSDLDLAMEAVIGSLDKFAAKVFNHFDPILANIDGSTADITARSGP